MRVGDEFGPSEWLEIDQERINRFAEATDDPQWIHVDPVRAAEGPFGTTIAQDLKPTLVTSGGAPEESDELVEESA